MADAGLLPRNDPTTGKLVTDAGMTVGAYFSKHYNLNAARAAYATPDDAGATLRDLYLTSRFDATTLLRETLHFFTGMDDDALGRKLGVKMAIDETGLLTSGDISDALKKGGCGH